MVRNDEEINMSKSRADLRDAVVAEHGNVVRVASRADISVAEVIAAVCEDPSYVFDRLKVVSALTTFYLLSTARTDFSGSLHSSSISDVGRTYASLLQSFLELTKIVANDS